jgi:hypothetical protein
LIRYSRACGSYQDFLDRGLLITRKLLTQGFLLVSWSHHFESFTVATMTWLAVMEYLCNKWPRICSTCRKHFPLPHSWLITRFVTRLTQRVPLVEQELPTLPKHLSSPLVFSGVCVTLVLYVCFVDRCLSLLSFFFWPWCSSFRFTDSDYHFGIFWPWCSSFRFTDSDYHFGIFWPWCSSFRFTDSDYHFGIFWPWCSSFRFTDSDYHFGIFKLFLYNS